MNIKNQLKYNSYNEFRLNSIEFIFNNVISIIFRLWYLHHLQAVLKLFFRILSKLTVNQNIESPKYKFDGEHDTKWNFYYLTLIIIKMSHQLKLYSTEINEYMFTRDANKKYNNKLDFMPYVIFSLIFHIPFLWQRLIASIQTSHDVLYSLTR